MRFLETVFELVRIYGMFYVLSLKSTSSELGIGGKRFGYGEGLNLLYLWCGVFQAPLNIYLSLRIDFPFSECLYLIQSCRMHCTHKLFH